jgi:hypothetical protein
MERRRGSKEQTADVCDEASGFQGSGFEGSDPVTERGGGGG